ncbi:3D domain-containing protein [Thalassotalea crassostreae]|uniref:3D domain-containing protein n=1 Tax=Thalassotalea crassostreae TaxID=1763536 RepID=UPI00083869E9|nr:3D domain-containing protein [Thalassotalea crassostreae]
MFYFTNMHLKSFTANFYQTAQTLCRIGVYSLALFTVFSCSNLNSRSAEYCENNWKITGYYTPIELDFKSKQTRLIRISSTQSYMLNEDFVNAVKIEGWGKTKFGWYLGYYGKTWHKQSKPLNAYGRALTKGAIAVDKNLIAKDSVVKIQGLESILNIDQFVAVDVGSAIKQKRIDVYTGEGLSAKQKTYAVTGNHQVCFNSLSPAPVISL